MTWFVLLKRALLKLGVQIKRVTHALNAQAWLKVVDIAAFDI